VLGEKFWELRRRNGWSQRKLAQRLGVSSSTISRYERGKARNPTKALQDRWAEVILDEAVGDISKRLEDERLSDEVQFARQRLERHPAEVEIPLLIYTDEYVKHLCRWWKVFSVPVFLSNPQAWPHHNPFSGNAEQAQILDWWRALHHSLGSVQKSCGRTHCYLDMNAAHLVRATSDKDISTAYGYKYNDAHEQAELWIWRLPALVEQVLYFLDKPLREGLSDKGVWHKIKGNLRKVASGTALSPDFQPGDLQSLTRVLDLHDLIEETKLGGISVRELRDLQSHRYPLAFDHQWFSISITPGRNTGNPVISAPGAAPSLEFEDIAQAMLPTWEKLCEMLETIALISTFAIPHAPPTERDL